VTGTLRVEGPDEIVRTYDLSDGPHEDDGCPLRSSTDLPVRMGFDGQGPWVSVRCSERGCAAAVTSRPHFDPDADVWPALALVDLIEAIEEKDAWQVTWTTIYCPTHRDPLGN
jgi:hypothetical protein